MHLCKYIFIITFIYIIQFTIFLHAIQLFCCIISITYTFNFLFWSAFLLSGDFADFSVGFRSAFFLSGDFADFWAGFGQHFFYWGILLTFQRCFGQHFSHSGTLLTFWRIVGRVDGMKKPPAGYQGDKGF